MKLLVVQFLVNLSLRLKKDSKHQWLNGVLAGYPLDNLKVRLIDGSYHAVDSDSLSFEICARSAYREALPKCKPVLMEPIMKVEVLTPEQNMGDVVGDLNRRRGQIEGMDSKKEQDQVIKAKVPLIRNVWLCNSNYVH
jgi:elongation factor G